MSVKDDSQLPLVILDRDGVINKESAEFVKNPDEWIPIEGSLEAIARICRAGYAVAIITNQSGIARRLFTTADLNDIHIKMLQQLKDLGGDIEAILFCPHGPDDGCQCRKPKPGLFEELVNRMSVRLDNVYAVGDSERDLIAAHAAGAKPVLVTTGNGKKTREDIAGYKSRWVENLPVFENLAAFADYLLKPAE
jgi:D-glycero-D-manno-heptose 1,7-bisphosphate phosphatase